MNERILELARQVWPDPNISHVNHMKFAELIVRECATAITDDELAKDSGTFMMDSYAKGMRYSAHLIKEHFGVKE